MAGISVDSPGRNAAMVEKLRLPFPLLSDPDGRQAIRPYGVWHEGRSYARPAAVIVAPGGPVAFREVGEDFADRLDEEEILAALVRLGLPPVTQDPPAPGQPAPGPRAVDVVTLPDYLRGGRSAVQALSARAPEARREAETMTKVYDRFLAALAARFHRPLAPGDDTPHRDREFRPRCGQEPQPGQGEPVPCCGSWPLSRPTFIAR